MHRDVECGTYQRDHIDQQVFCDNFDERVRKSVHRHWKKIDREARRGPVDPFEAMLTAGPQQQKRGRRSG